MQTANEELNRVLEEIEKITDFDARLYRSSTLRRRIGLRMKATNSKNYEDYLEYLRKDQSEFNNFLIALTINVSDFFRDRWVFRSLKEKIIPDLIELLKEENRKRIRIWSVGCSKGQEPYSLAILLHEVLNGEISDYQIIIHATDLNREVLEKAKTGIYSKKDVNNIPQRYLSKYFEREYGGYRVKDNLRNLVRFRYHDLIKGRSLGKFHLILCRNLFIFFEPLLQERLFEKLHSSLKRNGILVLGSAETPRNEYLFGTLFTKDHIYQKRKKVRSSKQRHLARL